MTTDIHRQELGDGAVENPAQPLHTEPMGFYSLLSDKKLGIKNAAVLLGVSASTLRRLVERGELPAIAMTSRLLFLERDLEDYLRAKRGFAKGRDDRPEVHPALPKHVLNSPYLRKLRKAA